MLNPCFFLGAGASLLLSSEDPESSELSESSEPSESSELPDSSELSESPELSESSEDSSLSEVSEALERHGFLLDEHNSPEKIQKRFFDGRSDGQKAYENIHFILAKKGDRFNESYYLYI